MAVNIFIDTNIFLSFYHISNEDLTELSKLAVGLNQREIVLFLPGQVVDEFHRNREVKVADAMNAFRKHNFKVSFPRMCIGYPEYEEIQSLIKKCSAAHSSLVNELEKDILSESLRADEVIGEIFEAAFRVETTDLLIERARTRVELGKPPGKSGSLGDAINWETLLSETPNSESLYIVSSDGDFASTIEKERIKPYLAKEWRHSKSSEVYFFRTLSSAFKELDFPIRLSEERLKSDCVADLENSANYRSTHAAVARLREFNNEFSPQQLNRMLCALRQNDQVGTIVLDEDVLEFYADLVDGRLDDIYIETLEDLRPMLESLVSIMEQGYLGEAAALRVQCFVPMLNLAPPAADPDYEDIPV